MEATRGIAVVGMGRAVPTVPEISRIAPPSVVLVDRKPDMNGTHFPITARAIAEVGSMISLVNEARSTNYWSSVQVMSDVKKQKAREKKRWAKIRRKQGRK